MTQMSRTVEEIMTRDPRTGKASDTIVDAARVMNESDIGDVIVVDGEEIRCIVTDRDIVVRAIAEGRDPQSTSVGDVCTQSLETIEPGASVDDALKKMRDADIRRLPVVQDGRPVGIISVGGLAVGGGADLGRAALSAASP